MLDKTFRKVKLIGWMVLIVFVIILLGFFGNESSVDDTDTARNRKLNPIPKEHLDGSELKGKAAARRPFWFESDQLLVGLQHVLRKDLGAQKLLIKADSVILLKIINAALNIRKWIFDWRAVMEPKLNMTYIEETERADCVIEMSDENAVYLLTKRRKVVQKSGFTVQCPEDVLAHFLFILGGHELAKNTNENPVEL